MNSLRVAIETYNPNGAIFAMFDYPNYVKSTLLGFHIVKRYAIYRGLYRPPHNKYFHTFGLYFEIPLDTKFRFEYSYIIASDDKQS